MNIPKESGKHTSRLSEEDMKTIKQVLRNVRPFEITPGRKCEGFVKIGRSPMQEINFRKMKQDINDIIERVCQRVSLPCDED